MTWTVQYEANELPPAATPAWTASHVPDPLVSSVVEISPAGILHIVGDGGEAISWFTAVDAKSPFANVDTGTVEFKAQMISGDLIASESGAQSIYFSMKQTNILLEIYPDGIGIYDNIALAYVTKYLTDTTDAYHTYRFTIDTGEIKLYKDSVLVYTGELTLGTPPDSGGLYFQPNYNNATEQKWDHIYYDTTGAYDPTITGQFMAVSKYW